MMGHFTARAAAPAPTARRPAASATDPLRPSLVDPLAAHAGMFPTVQRKTDIRHTTQSFSYVPPNKLSEKNPSKATQTVASTMEAWLDPNDPVVGSAPGDDQTDMMTSLKARYNLKPHQLVKGHLLNHDLGGYGVAENLFPITKQANGEHLAYAEYSVKEALSVARSGTDGIDGVYYYVNAIGPLDDESFDQTSHLVCSASYVKDIDDKRKIGKSVVNVTINSDVASPSGQFDEYVDDETGAIVESAKNPGALSSWAHKGKGANPAPYNHKTFREEQGFDGSKKTHIVVG